MYVLEVMSGPLDGTRWRFEHEITIGRDEGAVGACIAIDRYLSRSHARLTRDGGQVTLVDLSSRNGTTIDGQPVERALLQAGKAFTCGRTLMRVIVENADGRTDLMLTAPLSRVSTIEEMRLRLLTKPVGFVPTMGALHAGPKRLIESAQGESVVVSIFVNPLQFAVGEDFEHYPRDVQRDLRMLADQGVTMVFTPDAAELYGAQFATKIDIGDIGTRFEGAVRPTHFSGVATVLAKLLHIVAPSRLYLGQKDAQQAAVTRQFMRDLNFAAELVIVPTDRESDGLARSSRNIYLSAQERAFAPALYRALVTAAAVFREGALRRDAVKSGQKVIDEASAQAGLRAEIDYLEIVEPDTFTPFADQHEDRRTALAIGAMRMQKVRLLDNVPIGHG
jgi:pantoate--beta-alanine ligase